MKTGAYYRYVGLLLSVNKNEYILNGRGIFRLALVFVIVMYKVNKHSVVEATCIFNCTVHLLMFLIIDIVSLCSAIRHKNTHILNSSCLSMGIVSHTDHSIDTHP